jgi:phosphate-selective porin OprO and OprP
VATPLHKRIAELGPAVCPCDAGASNALYQYRTRGADLHLADRFIDTPQIFDSDEMFILETAFVWGPFSMQGEYAQLQADSPSGISSVSPTYNGWYIDTSWFLTGETRNYESTIGMFGRTKVKRPVFGGSSGWGRLADRRPL